MAAFHGAGEAPKTPTETPCIPSPLAPKFSPCFPPPATSMCPRHSRWVPSALGCAFCWLGQQLYAQFRVTRAQRSFPLQF